MLESLFRNSRFLVIIIVIMSFIASILLYISSISITGNIILEFFQDIPTTPSEGPLKAVKLLKALDVLLIALVFQIISVAHYHFFLSRNQDSKSLFLEVLHIDNYHDLKIIILQVSAIILAIVFLEQAVEVGGSLETLYLAISLALVILSLVFLMRNMKHKE